MRIYVQVPGGEARRSLPPASFGSGYLREIGGPAGGDMTTGLLENVLSSGRRRHPATAESEPGRLRAGWAPFPVTEVRVLGDYAVANGSDTLDGDLDDVAG